MRNRPVSKENIEATVGGGTVGGGTSVGTGAALDRASSASVERTTETREVFIVVRVAIASLELV